MPLLPPAIYASLQTTRAAGVNPFNGAAYSQLSLAVSQAIATWAVGQPQNVALVGAAVGAAGAGAVIPPTTTLIVPPVVPVMLTALQGAGLLGPLAMSLATSMTKGVSAAFTELAWYSGPCAGTAVGEDISKVTVSNAPALIGILRDTLAGAKVMGLASSQLAIGLGNGIAALVLLGVGTGTVAGVPVVPPGPGAGVTGPSVLL